MKIDSGQIINQRYQIIRVVGVGASAIVYLAKDLKKDIQLALKIQNATEEFSNMDERFKLEAKTLLELNHPNIVQTYDFFKWKGRRILVMEYVKGKTLDQIIREKRRLAPKDTVVYALEILSALSAVHKIGVMHRDLKPANIIINLENKVKLMDFGIVQTSQNQDLTKQSSIIGTIQYLAPEIFKGEKATPTSEIFSVGVLMYKMLSGSVPFHGTTPEETARIIMSKPPAKLSKLNPHVSEELEKIIEKALAKEYINRYRTTEEMTKDLKIVLKTYDTVRIKPVIVSDKDKKKKLVLKILKKD